MTMTPDELRYLGLAGELADLAEIDDNAEPAKRSAFVWRVEEMLREEYQRGLEARPTDG